MATIIGVDVGIKSCVTDSIGKNCGDWLYFEYKKKKPDTWAITECVETCAHRLVNTVKEHSADVIALEDLNPTTLKWPEYLVRTITLIKEISQAKRIRIILVPAPYTSQTCWRCGKRGKRKNVKQGNVGTDMFFCTIRGCEGFEGENPDTNAARFIAIQAAIILAKKRIKLGQSWKNHIGVLVNYYGQITAVEEIEWAKNQIG